ncbi:MAG: 4Fe-4S binding protein [Rhodospirillaceae bacterium]
MARILRVLLVCLSASAGPALAADPLSSGMLAGLFPGADAVGPFAGNPPAAPVIRAGQPVGFVLSTRDGPGSVGLSGKPFEVLVGLDLEARITGARLIEHHEPILMLGVEPARLEALISGHRGIDLRAPEPGLTTGSGRAGGPDIISGASVSSLLLHHSILASARAVARSRGLLGAGVSGPSVDTDRFERRDWPALLAEGAVARLDLTGAEVTARLAAAGGAAGIAPGAGSRFIDLYAALVTPAAIGRNLLGDRLFSHLVAAGTGEGQRVLIAANGLYSFKGTGFVRSGVFERVQLVQGERTLALTAAHHRLVEQLAEGMPEFREIGVFVLPASTGFDPAAPWRLELRVAGQRPDGRGVDAVFSLPYRLPARLLRPAVPAAGAPASAAAGVDWQSEWSSQPLTVGLTLLTLGLLIALLLAQDRLARRPLLLKRLRLGFLVFTVVWFGWCTQGQLSVANVITVLEMARTEFRLDYFLLLPVVFMLWLFIAGMMLCLGRGVFCGWLCPFGAMQELLYALARRLRLPVLRVPPRLHERLVLGKYLLFVGIVAASLDYTAAAIAAAEIEPFKTVMSLHFVRAWPFVIYAVGLLAAAVVTERFFCRYLCVLGAGLALPIRLRLFDGLKRRPQCGTECRACAVRCPVQAIDRRGVINLSECVYCLRCQINYFDPKVCPPLARERKAARHIIEQP